MPQIVPLTAECKKFCKSLLKHLQEEVADLKLQFTNNY